MLARLTTAEAVAIRCVHVHVTAIPAGAGGERGQREAGVFDRRVETNLHPIVRRNLRPDIRDRDQELPLSRGDGTWNVRGGCVRGPNGEVILVASALPTEPRRIMNAYVEDSLLFLAMIVRKVNGDAVHSRRHGEGNEEVRVILSDRYGAFQHYIRLLQLRMQRQRTRHEDGG